MLSASEYSCLKRKVPQYQTFLDGAELSSLTLPLDDLDKTNAPDGLVPNIECLVGITLVI